MNEQPSGTAVEDKTDEATATALPPDETRQHEAIAPRRLYRSRHDRMIAGVCGGLGQYFNVDPVIVRLVFLLLLFGGPGILAYIVLAIVVPERPPGEPEPAITSSINGDRGRQIAALILVALGVILLADNLRVYQIVDLGRFWPVVLILAGGLILLNRANDR